jgi:hypothetical protein
MTYSHVTGPESVRWRSSPPLTRRLTEEDANRARVCGVLINLRLLLSAGFRPRPRIPIGVAAVPLSCRCRD